jgi:hypothetical protein
VVLAFPLAVAVFPGVARAQFTYDGVAAADGTEVTLSNPSIPLGLVVTGAGPSTQARLTSLPTSDAFASFPFPGEVAAGAPGIISGVVPLPVPAYPFIVNTGLGDAPREQSAPGVDLETASERLAARSTALIGSATSGAESSTTVAVDPDDGVTAVAHAVARGLDLLSTFRIAAVDARATAGRDSSGALTRSSSLSISRLAVPGLAITLPKEFPIFGGQTVTGVDIGLVDGSFYVALPFAGAPQHVPVAKQTVIDALKAAGITATYQEPVQTKNGIVAAAFALTTDLPAPPPNGSYDGPTHVTYTFGRVSAEVSLAPIDDGPAAGSASAGTIAPGGSPGTVEGAGLQPGPGAPTDTGAPAGVEPGPATVNPGPGGTSSVEVAPAALGRRIPDTARVSDLYLVLIALGGLGMACVRAIRLRGVRLQ